MRKVASVDRDVCVGCGVCIKACPKDAMKVHRGCHAVVDETGCIGCGKCSRSCPAGCISIVEREVRP